MRWAIAERHVSHPLGSSLEMIQRSLARLSARQKAAVLSICLLPPGFLVGFAGAAMLGPRELPVSQLALKVVAAFLAIAALSALAWLAFGEHVTSESAFRILGERRRAAGKIRIELADLLSSAGRMALQVGAGAWDLGRRAAEVRRIGGRPFARREAQPKSADGQVAVRVIRRLGAPAPSMLLVAAPVSHEPSTVTTRSTDLAVLARALIEANNQSWRNQHVPVIAAISVVSLGRFRIHRALRRLPHRLSFTAPPLTVLLQGGEHPEQVAMLAWLALPRNVGRALQLTSLIGVDVEKIARLGISIVTLPAPRLGHEARADRASTSAALARLAESGIAVVGVDAGDSVVLSQLSALGVTLGEGEALSSSQAPVVERPAPGAPRVFKWRLTAVPTSPEEKPATSERRRADLAPDEAAAG